MRTLCDRDGLLVGFTMVSSVAPARSPRPILQNLKFVADPDGSLLLATDQEVGIRFRVLGVKVDQPGAAILPTQKMAQILKTSRDSELALETDDGGSILVRGLNARFKLPGEDPDLFPVFDDFTASAYHVVAAADLKKLIKRTIFATELESTRFALGGVLFEFSPEGNLLTGVGTDGRRLAHTQVPAEPEGGVTPPAGQPVIPVKALKLLDRNLDDDDPPVHIAFPSPNAVVIRTDRSVIWSRLVEGRFPRYRDVFPTSCEARIPIEAGLLRSRVEQAAIVTSDESRGVDFTFADGKLTLAARAADSGESQVEMPIRYSGATIEITFDPTYLLEMLKVLPEEEEIVIELIDDNNAAVIRHADRYSYILMPLSRDRSRDE